MAQTSTVPDFLDALGDLLGKRPGLRGVQVATAPVGEAGTKAESIQLDATDMAAEWGPIGDFAIDDDYTVSGFIWVVRPGGDEKTYRAVRRRAYELLDEVRIALRNDPSVGRTVRKALVTGGVLDQGIDGASGGRMARITFTISVESRLTVS